MHPAIQFRDLRKSFRKTNAVDGLTLDVPEGEVTAFLGPNGAGKTTSIKCALNLHPVDSGSVTVLGADSARLGPETFRQLGYVSENQDLPLWMSVTQFLDYCRPMYPNWDRDFEKKMLKSFELPGETKLKDLSRGMRMKASLLSSLAYRPKLVVLDEPFSGLDPLVRDEFIHGLLELTEEEGWTVFISSHDIEEVQRLADRVAILNRGQLQLDESASGLQSRFRTVEVVMPKEARPPEALPDTWLNVDAAGRTVRFTDSQYDEQALAGKLSEFFDGEIRHETAAMTLREIFVALARTYRL